MNTLARRKYDGKTCHISDFHGKYLPCKGALLCIDPKCETPVFAKNQGKIRAHHFAHYPVDGRACCSGTGNGGESEEHLFAKRWIAENIERLRFPRSRCVGCNYLEQFDTKHCTVEVEGRILSSRFRADVLLRDEQGVPRFAVEVFHTHRVDTVKAEFCKANQIQILEIKTEQCRQLREQLARLREDGPVQVQELVYPKVVDLRCKQCEERLKREEEVRKERLKREEEAKKERLKREEEARNERLKREEEARKERKKAMNVWIADNIKRIAFPKFRCDDCKRVNYFRETMQCTAEALSLTYMGADFDVLVRGPQGECVFAINISHLDCVSRYDKISENLQGVILFVITMDECARLQEAIKRTRGRVAVLNLLHPRPTSKRCPHCEQVLDYLLRDSERLEEVDQLFKWNEYMASWVEYCLLINRRRHWLLKGYQAVTEFKESEEYARWSAQKKKRPYVDKYRIKGKCWSCDDWLIEDPRFPSIIVVSRKQVSSWRGYNTNYYLQKYESGQFCSLCAMKCVRCSKHTPIDALEKYGCCYSCCTNMKTNIKMAEYDDLSDMDDG